MPQWASSEGGGSDAASPSQILSYNQTDCYDDKAEDADKIEQTAGK